MTSAPQITVIMPAYNCGPYIRKAIDSILDQTFTDFELVICDDGSADNTWDVIDSYSDNRIRKYRHEKNKGYRVTFNYLLSLASGSFICCQDADDWSDPQRLELQRELFQKFPDVGVVGMNAIFCYSESMQKPCAPFDDGYVTFDKDEFKFWIPAMMYRREVLEKVKGFHPYFDRLTSMDQYFLMEILSNFKGYIINRYLYFARFNPNSIQRSLDYDRKMTIHEAYKLLKTQRLERGSDWLLENRHNDLLEYEKSFLRNRKFLAEKYREYAVYRIDSGKPLSSLSLLMRSLFFNPLHAITYRTILYGFRKALMGQ